jgi:hypothetical protein
MKKLISNQSGEAVLIMFFSLLFLAGGHQAIKDKREKKEQEHYDKYHQSEQKWEQEVKEELERAQEYKLK